MEMWRLNQTKYNIYRAILEWKKDHFSSYFQKMQTQFLFIYHVTPLSCFQCTCILFSHQMNLNQGVRTFHQHHHDNNNNNSSSDCNNKKKKSTQTTSKSIRNERKKEILFENEKREMKKTMHKPKNRITCSRAPHNYT